MFPHPIKYYGLDRRELERAAKERTGFDLKAEYEGEVALFQVGLCPLAGHDNQFLFDARVFPREAFTEHFKAPLERSIVIGHNLTYEAEFLIAHYNIWLEEVRDTMIFGKFINAGDSYRHDLGMEYKKFFDYGWFIAEVQRSIDQYNEDKKNFQKSDWTDPNLTEGQLQYGADDVRLPMFLYQKMKDRLEELIKKFRSPNLLNTLLLNCDLVNEFALMKLRGVPLDIQHQTEVIEYLQEKRDSAISEVAKYPEFNREVEYSQQVLRPSLAKNAEPGHMVKKWEKYTVVEPINLNSNDQLPAALARIGIEVDNNQEGTLKKIRQEHPVINQILKYRKASSLLSKYGQKLIDLVHSDGKLHPHLNIIGTKTGRSSGSDPNMQNLPFRELLFGEVRAGERFRTSFTVPITPGVTWIWISADLSQIEPRMIGQISKDPELIIELSEEDGDLHGRAAQEFMGLDYKPGRGTYERDYIGKTGDLQVLYKAGAKAFSEFMYEETIDLDNPVIWTVDEAKDKINRFFDAFPKIKESMDQVDSRVRNHLNSYGSLRYFAYRKPVYEMVTYSKKYPLYKKWCLSEAQEKIAKKLIKIKNLQDHDDPLHRRTMVWDEEKERETNWNEFNKTANSISREAWNLLFQGDCATLFKLAMLNIGLELRQIPTLDPLTEGIVFPVHDEVNIIVKEQHREQAMEITKKWFIWAGEQFINVCPIKVEIKSGTNWAACH